MKSVLLASLVSLITCFSAQALAKTVRYELVVRNEKVNMSGKKEVDFALTVNGSIPAPTLEFTEGDDAEIVVKNEVPNQEVSIHWHGILLPPLEDGVAYVNTPPIFPGQSRTFRFKIRQHGTYWYHSHTGLQEQKGVYGAFIIHPKKKTIPYDKDLVVVLSDWSDENADQILRNLRKDGDYYLYKKDAIRSIFGAIQVGQLKTYFANEWIRMGGMDLSDVGYDAFLMNGKRDSQLLNSHPGERIRIRIINAAASSYFYVSLGQEPMTVISADGVDITPIRAKELLMGMAETYDILFTPKEHKNYELRATVQDVTGFASGWIGMGEKVRAPDKPAPDLYAPMDHGNHGDHHDGHSSEHGEHGKHQDHGAHGRHHKHHGERHGQGDHKQGHHGGHHGHHHGRGEHHSRRGHHGHGDRHDGHQKIDFSNQSGAVLAQTHSHWFTPAAKGPVVETLTVDSLRAIKPTELPKDAKIHDLKLVLGGDMERYVWHINGKAIHEDRYIEIDQGDIVRVTFENDTMMHHPMHLHGHFFRVINAGGELSPYKHTVDVPPHGNRTIEFLANEPGIWMLHCHNLYHMKNGMARFVKYRNFEQSPEMKKHERHDPHMHEHLYTHTSVLVASHQAHAASRLMQTWDEINLELETHNSEGKHFSFSEKWDLEGDLVYRRWLGNFLNIIGGGTLYHQKGYGMIGIGYTLPMLVETQLLVNHEGKLRLDLEKRFQWTKAVFTDAELTWRPNWGHDDDIEFEISLMYGPSWNWAVGLLATEKSVGVGAQVQF